MKKHHRNQLSQSISMALVGSVVVATVVVPAYAQDSDSALLEEVIVTAQKREQNLQDVAVSIQVLGNEQLENLYVRSFEDFINFLPTVSFTSQGGPGGPGFGQVYMRGIASGGDGNHSASMPSVGYYLDEQPVTTINQVLDIYMYDIARVETLAGPQGTLYGQGSQSGTIRIITNKPEIGVSEGGYDLEVNSVKSGDIGYDLNGFWNFPIGDSAAVRLVAWHQQTGGYIDQVPTTMYFPGPQPHLVDNSDFAREDANEVSKTGFRALLKVDLNENWSVTPGLMYQKADTEGYWEHNPEFFGDLETGRLWPADGSDDWYQASLTLDGSIGDIDMVYAGAYLDREQNYQYDYSDYTEYWAYYLTNPEYYDAPGYCVYYNDVGDCAIGTQYVDAQNDFTRQSHEVRFQSSADRRFRWVGGLFYQKQKHDFDLQYTVPDSAVATSVVEGGNVVWQTKQVREDRDTALFGEITYDFTEKFSGTFGARYFEYENSLYGFNGFLRHCTGQYIDGEFVEIPADEGGEVQYPCFDTRVLDDVAKGNDWAFKANLEYRIDNDKMVYFTWSEGFRAGGVNRARVEGIPKYGPDFVTNYEIGWKTTLADGAVRFNGAVYLLDWDDFQFGFLDFAVSNLTIVQNVGNSRTKGIEWELAWAMNDNNTLSFSGTYNDSELQTDFWRTQDLEDAGEPANAPAGTPMPYVPKWQLSGIWRTNFEVGALPAFFQAAVSYTGARWNDLDTLNVPARQKMDDYTLVNLSTGINKDNWTLSFYINNLFDERAEIDIEDPGYGGLPNLQRPPGHKWTTITNRPRSFGIRFSQRF
ncbi:MAG: TonB-dependent receptor [Gammaproteobacteria bacterium]|nr:TonB-dependent receptor [Gammaproteobacteria bacterium]